MKTRIIINVVLLAVVAGVTGGAVYWMLHRPKKDKPPPPEPTVPNVVAERVNLRANHTVELVGYGSARPTVSVPLIPQVSGKVVARSPNLRSGKYIQAGEKLIEIEKTDYQQQHDAAEKQIALLQAQIDKLDQERRNLVASITLAEDRVTLAESQLADARTLQQRGAASTSDVDAARDALLARKEQWQQIVNQLALLDPRRKQLEAQKAVYAVQRDQAQTALDRTTMTSPVTGRVLKSQVEKHLLVTAGQVYGQVYELGRMEIPVSVPATDLAWIDRSLLVPDQEGKTPAEKYKLIRATVRWTAPNNGRAVKWDGYVGRIEAGLEERTRTARLVVYVENPPLGQGEPLDRNMFCRVTIYGKTVPRCLMIPRQAIGPDGHVYVVEDGRLGIRRVSVLRYTDSQAMLAAGESEPPATPDGPPQPTTPGASSSGGAKAPPLLRPGDVLCTGYVPAPVPGMHVNVLAPATRPDSQPAAPATQPAGADEGAS